MPAHVLFVTVTLTEPSFGRPSMPIGIPPTSFEIDRPGASTWYVNVVVLSALSASVAAVTDPPSRTSAIAVDAKYSAADVSFSTPVIETSCLTVAEMVTAPPACTIPETATCAVVGVDATGVVDATWFSAYAANVTLPVVWMSASDRTTIVSASITSAAEPRAIGPPIVILSTPPPPLIVSDSVGTSNVVNSKASGSRRARGSASSRSASASRRRRARAEVEDDLVERPRVNAIGSSPA